MREGAALLCALCIALTAAAAAESDAPPAARVEARSAALLAVGTVAGERMSIHVSRLIDNAPVRDAVVTVLLRGVVHPTTAEPDGSYLLRADDLSLPGAAAVQVHVLQGQKVEDLRGVLSVNPAVKPEEKSSARQLWWWVLNFGVCTGFLLLFSRRRKAAARQAAAQDESL